MDSESPHGPPICIVRWIDLISGEAFQEARSPSAVEGLMDALALSEVTANMIFVDIAMHECRVPLHSSPLSTDEWDVIRGAFRKGQYVLVSLHPPGEISYEQLHAIMPDLPADKALEYLPFLIAEFASGVRSTRDGATSGTRNPAMGQSSKGAVPFS